MKPTFRSRSFRPLIAPLAVVSLTVTAVPVLAVTGSWNADAAGNWTDATKWTGGIPNAEGDTANLTANFSASRIISLAGNKTVGTINIGDSTAAFANCTINSGGSTPTASLTLDQTGVADAVVTVPNVGGIAANSISCYGLLLKDNLRIDTQFPDSNLNQMSISAIISDATGSYGITKAGPGIAILSGPNSYKGGTTVADGRLTVSNQVALGTGAVTITQGQVFLNTNCVGNFSIAGTGYVNSADTAAQAGAIRIASNRTLLGNVNVAAPARLGVNAADFGSVVGNLTGAGNLEINSPATTTGMVVLLGDGSGFTGTLSLASGSFSFSGALGGSVAVAPVVGTTTVLGLGTSIGGNLSLDSTNADATIRNHKGVVTIAGNLDLTDITPVVPSSFPAPGTTTLTVLTYAAKTGTGTLTFDNVGFRGTPSLTVTPTAAIINGLDAKSLIWDNTSTDGLWNVGVSANWKGGDTAFYHADAVVFDDTAPGAVTIDGIVRPQSITVTNTGTNDYALNSGTIDACGGGITKNGDAFLTLAGNNTFAGPVKVNAGRLIVGSKTALGYTSGVTVKSGAAFDISGQDLTTSARVCDLAIAGEGDGGLPALGNNGAAITFTGSPKSGIRNVTLTADATVGGSASKTFDIAGIVDGGGFTLTKTGANQVWLLGISKNLKTVVAEGSLSGFGPDPFGSTLTLKGTGVAQSSNPGVYTSDVIFDNGGKLEHTVGIEALWTGTFTAAGDAELANGNTSSTNLNVLKGFAVGGNLTRSGGGTVTLQGDCDVAGTVTINGGPLVLGIGGATGSIGAIAPINLASAQASLTVNRSDNPVFPNLISGTGSITKSGSGTLTLTADNSYSSNTNVAAGTLLVNGNQSGTGNVNVNSGSTLGGNGTLLGTINAVAGSTVSPGVAIGTLTTGSSGKTTTISGKLRIEFDGSAAVPIDRLKVVNALALGAASIIDFDAVGTALTAPAYVIATYATLTGTFATVTDLPAGYALNYAFNDGVTSTNIALVKTATPYELWIGGFYPGESNPAIVGPAADPDMDGLKNLLENYLGTSPKTSSVGLTQVSANGTSVTFEHSRADAPLASSTPAYEWSTDLGVWSASGDTLGGVKVTISPTVLTDNPSPANDVMQVVATVNSGTAPMLFVRMKITQP